MSATSQVVSATTVHALTENQVKNLPYVGIAVVVLLALLLVKMFTSAVMRIVTLAVMLTVGSSLYVQRGKAIDEINKMVSNKCTTAASFFGIKVDPSDPQVKKLCEEAQKLKSGLPKK